MLPIGATLFGIDLVSSTTIIAPTFLAAANFIIFGVVVRRAGAQFSYIPAKQCAYALCRSSTWSFVPDNATLFRCVDICYYRHSSFGRPGAIQPSVSFRSMQNLIRPNVS
jgi:hypothetical protein